MSNTATLYLDALASEIRERADPLAEPPYNDIRLYRLYALLCRVKGTATTAEDVHDAWALWAAEYRPHSPWIVPFADLPPGMQAQDEPFVRAIREEAAAIRHAVDGRDALNMALVERVAVLVEALRTAEAVLSLLYFRAGIRTVDGTRGTSSGGDLSDAIDKARAALGDRR